MSLNSLFSVDDVGAPSNQSPSTKELSHEFSIAKYDYNEDSNEGNVIQVATSVVGGGQTKVPERNEAPIVCVEEIQSASLMHFKRVSHRMH